MAEQERHFPEEEIKRKLVATNALITDEELRKLKDRQNRAVLVKTTEIAVSVDNPSKTHARNKDYTFVLEDVGVYIDPQTGNKYLTYLVELQGQRFFTRMRWVREGQIEGRMEKFLYEGTINDVAFREGMESDDSTLWSDFPIWEFKNPGQFLEKDDDKSVDDFAQALPLIQSYADLKI